jgi:peptidoglycan/xylan/chitin deacetylase (PgdA/CDA1 family)
MSVDLPVGLFDAQMAELAESGRVIQLDQAVDLLSTPAHPRFDATTAVDPPVVVTFDDGTADLVEFATPILERHGVPASLFLVTDYVDRRLSFRSEGLAVSWSEVADLSSSDMWTIESHTHSHVLLDRIADDQVAGELDRSIELIGEHTGRRPQHFAYPKAVPGTPVADAAVRERFRSAALGGTRINRPDRTDLYRLSRSSIQRGDAMTWFRHKATGGMRIEGDLRRALDRVRYLRSST